MGFQIGIKDIFDIFLVAVLLYQIFRLLKKSGAVNVFFGVMAFVIAWFLVSYVFELQLIGAIFNKIVSVGAIAFIVIFQEEVRTFFSRIGTRSTWHTITQFAEKISGKKEQIKHDEAIVQLVFACKNLSKTRTGALIIIEREQELKSFVNSGELIDANINSRLIENIFFKNSPLHDGALILSKGRLQAASCIMPISKNPEIPKRFGLRHRAALGISEKTDAIAIVVSEETGKISVAINDKITANVKPEELERFLSIRLEQKKELD